MKTTSNLKAQCESEILEAFERILGRLSLYPTCLGPWGLFLELPWFDRARESTSEIEAGLE
jgi:hypothetical protein